MSIRLNGSHFVRINDSVRKEKCDVVGDMVSYLNVIVV